MFYELVSSKYQLFAMSIKLRRGLKLLDVCTRFKITETTYNHMFSTYSRMFSTWVLFYQKI